MSYLEHITAAIDAITTSGPMQANRDEERALWMVNRASRCARQIGRSPKAAKLANDLTSGVLICRDSDDYPGRYVVWTINRDGTLSHGHYNLTWPTAKQVSTYKQERGGFWSTGLSFGFEPDGFAVRF